MKREYFGELPNLSFDETAVMMPTKLYKQERDWTCAIACIRSILSSMNYTKTEDEIIEEFQLTPGPLYSKQIKNLNILENYETIYGFEFETKPTLSDFYTLMKDNYFVMIESMINFDHWLVALAYLPNGQDITANHTILLYDPYFNEVKTYRAEEFGAMWCSGMHVKNKVTNDFIAVKYQNLT